MISISTLRAAGLTDQQIDVVQKAVEAEKARWKADFEDREKLAAKRERNRINQRNYRERKRVSLDVIKGAKIPEQNQRARKLLSSTVIDCHQAFDEFWKVYPKRGGASNPKKPARDKFERAVRSGVDPLEIVAAALRYRDIEQKAGRAGSEKVAQAMTWLNQQRWIDYQAAAPDLPLELIHGAKHPTGVYVKSDTPEWDAWCRYLRKTSLPTDKAGGWRFDTLWPPDMAPQGAH